MHERAAGKDCGRRADQRDPRHRRRCWLLGFGVKRSHGQQPCGKLSDGSSMRFEDKICLFEALEPKAALVQRGEDGTELGLGSAPQWSRDDNKSVDSYQDEKFEVVDPLLLDSSDRTDRDDRKQRGRDAGLQALETFDGKDDPATKTDEGRTPAGQNRDTGTAAGSQENHQLWGGVHWWTGGQRQSPGGIECFGGQHRGRRAADCYEVGQTAPGLVFEKWLEERK